MSHLVVLVDGQERFNGEVPTAYLPKRDAMFPRALGMDGPKTSAPFTLLPMQRLAMLTTMIEGFVRALESPILQPITVDAKPNGVGSFTINRESADVD